MQCAFGSLDLRRKFCDASDYLRAADIATGYQYDNFHCDNFMDGSGFGSGQWL